MKLIPFSRHRKAVRPRIRPQRMGFDFQPESVPRYWFNNDPVLTHFLNALSLSFPDGEQFFVDSVRHFRDVVTDPERQKDISGFIGQEAMHSLEHKGFNAMLAAQGYGEIADKAGSIARYLCNEGRKRFSPRAQLAVTAGLEHITAILANAILRQPGLLDEMDPSVRMLWLWHAIEETEHKAVAFDLYKDIDPGYRMRVRAFLTGSLGLLVFSSTWTWRFLKQDGMHRKPLTLLRGGARLARFLGGVVPDYLDYLRPGFHPWDDDNSALIDRYRGAVDSAIAPQFRKPDPLAA
ncbi:MAG TPA: metal-dependent hydrolase [Moraxellaceae bacterium]|nr:metal-dependent hydrolase [Moraxellaceae bacterium]